MGRKESNQTNKQKTLKVSKYTQEIPQSHTADQPIERKRHITLTGTSYQEDILSKVTSSLFLLKDDCTTRKDTK